MSWIMEHERILGWVWKLEIDPHVKMKSIADFYKVYLSTIDSIQYRFLGNIVGICSFCQKHKNVKCFLL